MARIFLVLILLGSLIGTAFVFKSSPPKDVKMTSPQEVKNSLYQDKTYQFQFEYSADQIVVEDSEEQFFKRGGGNFRQNFTFYVGYQPPKVVKAISILPFEKSPLTIWILENPNQFSAEGFYKQYWYYPFVWGQFAEPQKSSVAPIIEATISGKIAKYGVVSYQKDSPKYYYVDNGDLMYLFRIIDTPDSLGDKILSSFKFTSW